MTNEEVTKNIWRNTVSNYICIILRLGFGLLMFRMLYQALSAEDFGFWALLWSLFGFGILLDFGFGIAAVKRVAELSVAQDWKELSRVLSTIFYLYVVVGAVIIITVLLGADVMIRVLQITPEKGAFYRELLIIFFFGVGIMFPFGIFPEILIGQQRITLVNIIFSVAIFGNFILLAAAMYFQLGLKVYLLIGLVSGLVPCAVSGLYCFRHLPEVRIRPGLFSWNMVHSTMRFSIFAYLITVSGLLLTKVDKIVISTALAVSGVAIYQAGAKVGELFGAIAQQLPDTFSPAAAHLHAKGDHQFLRKLLINGTRFTLMIATPFYLVCAFYMEGIIRLLTGSIPSTETFWVGQVLLFWGYTAAVTQSVSKRIFLMCGHEKRLTQLSVAEAIINLVLSISLVLYFRNVICVAVASLVSTFIIGWCFLWPWAARQAEMSGWQLARVVLIPIWISCLPLLGFVIAGRWSPWLDFRTSTALFMTECAIAMAIGAICVWCWALTIEERRHLLLKFGKRVNSSTV